MQVSRKMNIRVVVVPQISPVHYLLGKPTKEIEELTLVEARRISADIRRHVDGADPEVVWDSVKVCEFCGDDSDWKGESVECCHDAVNENDAVSRGE
jgi:hypothetical protein